MAAKRLAPDERLLRIEAADRVEGYQVHSRRSDQAPEANVLTDTVPGEVERVPGEHGEVRVSPAVERLLRRARERRLGRGLGR